MQKKNTIAALGVVFACAAMADEESFHQHGAHVHGQVQMTIAAVDNELMIDWHTPAGDIFGFEHTPESEQQKTTIEAELAWLKSAAWVAFDGLRDCELHHSRAHTTLLDDSHSGHGDVEVSMHWQCDPAIELRSIEITLFERYQKLESIHYDWLSNDQAGSGELAAPRQQIRF